MIQLIKLNEIQSLLADTSTIAVVGLSPKKQRPSYMVAEYLLDAGYTVIPVNPGHNEILGRKCYPNLSAVPDPVDIVDIFRKPADVLPIVEEAIAKKCRAVWMQLGIIHEEAAELARKNNIMVIMDRCIKVDHASLFPRN